MTHTELIRAYLQCIKTNNIERAKKYLSNDCLFSDPLLGAQISTEDYFKRSKDYIATIEDLRIISITEDKSWVASHYIIDSRIHLELYCSGWFNIHHGVIAVANSFYDSYPIREGLCGLNTRV